MRFLSTSYILLLQNVHRWFPDLFDHDDHNPANRWMRNVAEPERHDNRILIQDFCYHRRRCMEDEYGSSPVKWTTKNVNVRRCITHRPSITILSRGPMHKRIYPEIVLRLIFSNSLLEIHVKISLFLGNKSSSFQKKRGSVCHLGPIMIIIIVVVVVHNVEKRNNIKFHSGATRWLPASGTGYRTYFIHRHQLLI